MLKLRTGFTLVELIVVIAISSIILTAGGLMFPYVLSTFETQRETLEFQKKSLIDTTYILEQLSGAERFLSKSSSGSIAADRNSFGYFLNKSNGSRLPFSMVGLFDKNRLYAKNPTGTQKVLGVRDGFLQNSFVEARGSIYFTEPGQHIIKKMTLAGANPIVAFGQAGTAGNSNAGIGTFTTPTGLAYDGVKYLYVCDSGNQLIRRIDLDANTVSTFLGQSGQFGYNSTETTTVGTPFSSVMLHTPLGIAANASTVYIADTYNNRIRKADIASQKLYTIAGSDIFGSNGDTFATATDATLNYPVGMVSFSGGVLFADSVNGKIRYLDDSAHSLRTFAGLSLPSMAAHYADDRYVKLDFTTTVQYQGSQIYFNDLSHGILYQMTAGWDGIFGTADDVVSKKLGNFDNNLMVNGDIEYSISGSGSDIKTVNPSFNISQASNTQGAPKSGSGYLAVDARGAYASGSLTFATSTNPSDGATLQLGGYTYEFDNNATYTAGNIVIPLAATFADTFDNLVTELKQHPSVYVTQSGTNTILLRAKNYGTTGNSLALSTTSPAITLSPSGGALGNGADFGTGTLSFYTDKKLIDGEKYRLAFYMKDSQSERSDIFTPLIEITAGGANVSHKITKTDTVWTYHEYVFSGVNPSGNDLQRLEFFIKKGTYMFFDEISLTSLGTRESDQNTATFRIDILPSFFVNATTGIFVMDAYNRKLKYVDPTADSVATVASWVQLSDPYVCVLDGKDDFIGNSALEGVTFEYFTFNNLAPAKIQYSLSNGTSTLKLIGNVTH